MTQKYRLSEFSYTFPYQIKYYELPVGALHAAVDNYFSIYGNSVEQIVERVNDTHPHVHQLYEYDARIAQRDRRSELAWFMKHSQCQLYDCVNTTTKYGWHMFANIVSIFSHTLGYAMRAPCFVNNTYKICPIYADSFYVAMQLLRTVASDIKDTSPEAKMIIAVPEISSNDFHLFLQSIHGAFLKFLMDISSTHSIADVADFSCIFSTFDQGLFPDC
jgi:hypothetical protein